MSEYSCLSLTKRYVNTQSLSLKNLGLLLATACTKHRLSCMETAGKTGQSKLGYQMTEPIVSLSQVTRKYTMLL